MLDDGAMPPSVNNLMDSFPGETKTFRTLLDLPGIRLQQIASNGQSSEVGFWSGEPPLIPAERFAERSEVTGKLIWDDVADGFVIRGPLDIQASRPLVKVVTRASTSTELERFQHRRMPLLEAPLFQPLPARANDRMEPDLFG